MLRSDQPCRLSKWTEKFEAWAPHHFSIETFIRDPSYDAPYCWILLDIVTISHRVDPLEPLNIAIGYSPVASYLPDRPIGRAHQFVFANINIANKNAVYLGYKNWLTL